MRRRRFLSAGLSVMALPRQGHSDEFYEEALYHSSPYQVAQWREMHAYIQSLPSSSLPPLSEDDNAGERPVAALRERIGFPAPRLTLGGRTIILPAGEDVLARYYRRWTPVHESMHTYGLLLVPRALRARAPLVIALHGNVGYPDLALCALGVAPRPLQLQYGIQDPLARIQAARRTRRHLNDLAAKHIVAMPLLHYHE